MGRKALLIVLMAAGFACGEDTELKPGRCEKDNDCQTGVCDVSTKVCVKPDSGVLADALGAASDTQVVSPDASAVDRPLLPTDTGALDAAADAPMADTPVGDTPTGCRDSSDCPGTRSVCVAGACVECANAEDCRDPGKAFCVGGTCVGCEQAGANACPGKVCAPMGTPDAGGQCVECVTSANCKSATAPVCVDNACVGCSSGEQCESKNAEMPACLMSAGTCVACVASADCPPGTPICDTKTNTCVGCTNSLGCPASNPICTAGVCGKCGANIQCKDRGDLSTAMCDPASGACVQCTGNSDCVGNSKYCEPTAKKCVECLTSATCAATTPICQGNVCMTCTSHKQCADRNPATQGCAPNGTCVACTEKSHCQAPTPECDVLSNKCVQCLDDSGCSGTTPLCVGNKCVACSSNDQCGKKNAATSACVLLGAKAGSCVECKDDTTCSQDGKVCNKDTNLCVECVDHTKCSGTTPLCSNNACVGCSGLAATECRAKNQALPACAPTGACVQCTNSSGCSGSTSVCKPETYSCVECLDDDKCSGTLKRCKVDTNTCVECLGSGDCSGTKPVCNANKTCQPCQRDNECSAISAGVDGVCMLDGHCASSSETIVVTATSGNLPATEADIPAGKTLLVIQGAVSGSLAWNLTSRLQPMTIAGQNTGTLSGSQPIHVSGGDLYVKNLTVTGGSPGIEADTAGIIRLNRVRAVNNQGAGIVVDRARFDISNTTITDNGLSAGPGIRLTNLSSITSAPMSLTYLNVSDNSGGGVFCDTDGDAPLVATGVLATGNGGGTQVTTATCKFSPCTTASTTCGPQP